MTSTPSARSDSITACEPVIFFIKKPAYPGGVCDRQNHPPLGGNKNDDSEKMQFHTIILSRVIVTDIKGGVNE